MLNPGSPAMHGASGVFNFSGGRVISGGSRRDATWASLSERPNQSPVHSVAESALGLTCRFFASSPPKVNQPDEASTPLNHARICPKSSDDALSYKDDVDLGAKLDEWENFYNFNRPHGAFNRKTPYEALREKL